MTWPLAQSPENTASGKGLCAPPLSARATPDRSEAASGSGKEGVPTRGRVTAPASEYQGQPVVPCFRLVRADAPQLGTEGIPPSMGQ